MTITFISNYINHHQLPFCDALSELIGVGFIFVQTERMEGERIQMGWDDEGEKRDYVRKFYEDEEKVLRNIESCDILLAGWYTDKRVKETVINRVKRNQPTFRISERIYRNGRWRYFSPRGLIQKYMEHTRFRHSKYYLLCAGSYVADDFRLIASYPGKKYRWGYFPTLVKYDEEFWRNKGKNEATTICWAGRFMPLKHPEYMLRLARDLQDKGYNFHMNMIGSGEMEESLKRRAVDYDLSDKISFLGFASPKYVREIMEKSDIFVFTSDNREGWGAVVNEAMNSGCAVVASAEAGATGYLIKNRKNGFIYPNNNYEKMRALVEILLNDNELRIEMAQNAYQTITEVWNAEKAAIEFVRVSNEILEGKDIIPTEEGPLSIT